MNATRKREYAESDMNELLKGTLSQKLEACLNWVNPQTQFDFLEDIVSSICDDYDDNPVNSTPIFILEKKLDAKIISHFSED